MELDFPTPIHIIHDSRYARQDGWVVDDVSLCSSGNIAVSGNNYRPYQTNVYIYSSIDDNSDSRDKPTLIYHKHFTHKGLLWPRYISFIKPNSTEIVTCRYNEIEVIDYNRDVVLRSRNVNGVTTCVSVSESQIFIGLLSDIINIYDNDLNRIKSIRLKGIKGDFPKDIVAAADRLYVRTEYNRAIVYSQYSSNILTEYTTGQGSSIAYSIAVNIQLKMVAVLWDWKHVSVYSFSDNNCLVDFNVESGVTRIRILDGGRIVTGNEDSGEIKIYDLARILSYNHLKENLASRLGRDDCEKLTDFFAMGGEELNTILSSDSRAAALLLALEKKGVIQPTNVDGLEEAFLGLKMNSLFYHVVNFYQKLRDQINSYDRLLATLSAHLTSSVPTQLCDYFHISEERKNTIISSQNPGLSLLLVLDDMGVIKSSDVKSLEEPLNELRLVQAVAKIHEYKEILHEENRWKLQTESFNFEDKKAMFVEFLKRKIKSWYETMTPVPWKKSCEWKSTDLFVGSRLILTDSKSKQNVQNIDEKCKLNYTEIFTHEKLKGEIRIILEGDPGGGKTMLSSQLAYDWMEEKIDGVDILIFLPLKIVEDKTLIQAVEEFYIPPNTPLSRSDIESILASDTDSICLLLDGLEEYSTGGRMQAKETSEVMKIMKKEKHSNCKVVITSRSDFAHDLPECPMLKLGRLVESERNSYIEKLFPCNSEKQQKIKILIQENPFILDLCSVPLLFVLAVHNIEDMDLSEEIQLNKVSPFMRSMILTLCSSSTVKHEVDGIQSEFFRTEKMTLGELAFKGLCKGHQQLSWQKEFMESNVGSIKPWVDSGILVLEESLVISQTVDQDIFEMKKVKEKKEKMKKKKKKKNKKQRTQKVEAKDKGKRRQEKDPKEDLSGKPKKKKKDREAEESEVAPDEIPIKQFFGPSTSHNFPQLPFISEGTVTSSIDASVAEVETSKIDEPHGSVVEVETDPYVERKKTVKRTASQVPLTVKFLHKVIQEWFAATFFCSKMKMCSSEDQFKNYVSSQLQHISPTDLHYVLRFTSYLHPPSCHVIMNYLLRSYRKDGSVPPYIMNCMFLCFNEHNDDIGNEMKNVIEDVCKEVITLQSEDSRLLQQAKSALVQYASNNGITIEKLQLRDVISSVDQMSLIFNSGVQLGILYTVKLIEVSRWDQVLQEEDYKNILKLFAAGNLLKEVCCIFPSQPPGILDEITLGNIASKDIKVEWHIGNFVHSLDPIKGEWMIDFKLAGTSLLNKKDVCENQGLKSTEMFCQDASRNDKERKQATASYLPGTSEEASKYSHTQRTLKRIGNDRGVDEPAVIERNAKVNLEGTAKSDFTQEDQKGEQRGVFDEITDKGATGRDFQEVAVERDLSREGIPVTSILHQCDQEQSAAGGKRLKLDQMTMSLGRSSFKESSASNIPLPTFFLSEACSDVVPRTFSEDDFVQSAQQGNAPFLGNVPSHLTAENNEVQMLQSQSAITQSGGVIAIPDTGVILKVPPNALPEHMDSCLIQMRIIPTCISHDEIVSFSSNSSVQVELLPNHFKFLCPVQLTLPHCLELRKHAPRRARIFMSHHNEGEMPQWEEQTEHFYQVMETTVIIWLKGFCWIKCEIDDEIVEAKRLKIYTAARKMYFEDKHAVVEVGYHLDMPGEQEILKINPKLILADRKPFVFLREGKESLFIHFVRIVPSQWKYYDQNPKEIPFQSIAASLEQTCQFLVEKETKDRDIPMCMFIALQRHRSVDRTVELMIRPEVHPFATPWDVR